MKAFTKCEVCNVKIPSRERCIFAVYKRTIDGEEHYFCCEHHAEEYEKKHKKQ